MGIWEYMTETNRDNTLNVDKCRTNVQDTYPDLTTDRVGHVIFANNVLHKRYQPSDDPGHYTEFGYYYTDNRNNRRIIAVKSGNPNYRRRSDIPDDDVLYDAEECE